MTGFGLGIVIAAALAVGPVGAAESAGPVGPLIAKLKSPSYREREAAGRELKQSGPDALPALEAARATAPEPDVRRQLDTIIDWIVLQHLVAPTRVTVRADGLTTRAALARISELGGCRIAVVGNLDDVKHDLNLVGVPYWQAVDVVCDAAGVTTEIQDGMGLVTVSKADRLNPHIAYYGPFRVVATDALTRRSVRFSQPESDRAAARGGATVVDLSLYAEHKAPILGVGHPSILSANDDTGESLLDRRDRGQADGGGIKWSYCPVHNPSLRVDLLPSDHRARFIKQLCGTIPVVVVKETRADVAIEGLAEGKEFTGESESLRITVTDLTDRKAGITATLKFDLKNGVETDRVWCQSLIHRVVVTDQDGEKYSTDSGWSQFPSRSSYVTQMTFQPRGNKRRAPGKPTKLEFQEWVTRTISVPFEFKDVPLP